MDSSQSELEAIRRILAELINRVSRIEQRLGMDAPSSSPEHVGTAALGRPAAQSAAVPTTPLLPRTPPPSRPSIPASLQPEPDLESRIGSHWLNRIGIAALLIGVSYFLKFAFDNNWIGPAGRITIGLIAGIAVVIWSERFRRKDYKAFSYSLKAVGIGTLYL